MGLIADAAKGKCDFVHADPDNLSDTRTWPFPRKQGAEDSKDDGKGVENNTEQSTDVPNSENGENT